ncbi:MAG TPA: hypothetical protein VIH45_04405 [Desulfuromonadaceae bacterium]
MHTWYRRSAILATVALATLSGSGYAAEKTKPYPHYWISVATTNQNMPGMSEEMAGMAALFGGKGPAFGPRRELTLQVESPRPMPDKPQAAHEIPPVQNMGSSLPLLTPRREKPAREMPDEMPTPVKREIPEEYEKPKGRMLFYWGCGETVAAGQPKVLDATKMKPEEMGKFFKSRTPSQQTPPSDRKGWVYGEWPNSEERKDVPADSSLVGEHQITGNYLPDIRFSLDKKRDFMAPVEFSTLQPTPAGAIKVEWKPIPTAIGYFATAMGQNAKGDTVFWSSSEVQEMGSALMNYLTPGDVARFIKEKVVMEPVRTSCTVPPVFKDGQGGMLQFIAYGEQLDIVHPPKPKDPKQPWNPQWSLKVRLKSYGMSPLAAAGAESGRRERPAAASSRKKQEQAEVREDESRERTRPQGGEADEESQRGKGIGNRLRGLFGF